MTFGFDVHEQMFRSGCQPEAKPPVFSYQESFVLIYRPTEGYARNPPGEGSNVRIRRKDPATRGLLATNPVILNHGQVTWTTPEMAPPFLTTTPHQREDVSALDRFNVHPGPHGGICVPEPYKIDNFIEDVVNLARHINLEGDSDDIHDFLDTHNQKLTLDEFIEMHEQEQDIAKLESLGPVQSKDRMNVGNLTKGLSLILKKGLQITHSNDNNFLNKTRNKKMISMLRRNSAGEKKTLSRQRPLDRFYETFYIKITLA
ncbi:tigger transposable element-derived protein 1 [Trichonephila clavipes]|nr:tigger transposable element-derived protein 1 [Trichonephila clavipes]